MLNLLDWIQRWYSQQCDGDWEHSYGIKIDTLDNPGWSVRINVFETILEDKEFNLLKIERNENDWIHCRVKSGCFEGFGGVYNLEEILTLFKDWAIENSKAK